MAGAWVGTLVSFAAMLFTSKIAFTTGAAEFVLWDFNKHFADYLPAFMVWDEKLYLPWQMVFYLVAGMIGLVVTSLLTRRVPSDRLDRLYECLRTPIGTDEPEGAVFTLPDGVESAPRKVSISHPDFEIPQPSRVGLLGFIASWAAVAMLIGAVYWIIG